MELFSFISFSIMTVWFMLGSSIFLILLIFCVEHEYTIRSGFAVIAYICFLQFLIKINIYKTIIDHPIKTFMFIFGYFLIGFIWSTIKWFIYVNKQAHKYKEERYSFLTDKNRVSIVIEKKNYTDKTNITLETTIPDCLLDDWKRLTSSNLLQMPRAHENKNKISNWLIYWPASIIWSLLHDLIKNLIDIVIIKLRFLYDMIAKRAYKGIEKI